MRDYWTAKKRYIAIWREGDYFVLKIIINLLKVQILTLYFSEIENLICILPKKLIVFTQFFFVIFYTLDLN